MRNNGEDLYESFMTVDGGIQFMNNQINALRSNVLNLQENIQKTNRREPHRFSAKNPVLFFL